MEALRLNHNCKSDLPIVAQIIRPSRIAKGIARGLFRLDEDGCLERRCSRCGEYWPADTEFFTTGSSHCRACELERNRKSQ